MTIQLTAVLDIALTHTADSESALTALAKAAATEPGVLDHGFWRDPTHPGAPRCRNLQRPPAVAGHRLPRASRNPLRPHPDPDAPHLARSAAVLSRSSQVTRSVTVSSLDGGRHA